MARYDALREFLAEQPDQVGEVSMSFADVEGVVGPLPNSAREYRAWWGNDSRGQAIAWQSAGWRVASVDLLGERVIFRRDRMPDAVVHAKTAASGTAEAVGRHIFVSYSHTDAIYVSRL